MARIPKQYQEDAWQAFKDWCLAKGLNAVPAHPWTMAAYALVFEGQEKPAEIRKIIVAVAQAHREKSKSSPERHPMIERTLKIIAARQDIQKKSSKLFDEDLTIAKKTKKAAKSKKAETSKTADNAKKQLSMSATPKLVSRRKL